jgi:hypothetical protein
MQQEAEALAVMEARATAAAKQRLQLEQQLQRDDGGEVEKLKTQVSLLKTLLYLVMYSTQYTENAVFTCHMSGMHSYTPTVCKHHDTTLHHCGAICTAWHHVELMRHRA